MRINEIAEAMIASTFCVSAVKGRFVHRRDAEDAER
jgi:hypothetical protein